MKPQSLLGGLTHQQFLDEYWQQKPLLVRQAFPEIQAPCPAEELAGLCCDTDVNSRLVVENGETPWQLIQAPLDEEHFLNLPDTHWTLLINDFELYYPQLLSLLDKFRFIPDWRIDDLMISYAPEGGSVGPHIDEYDVFLIQAAGKRHWMLDETANAENLLPDTDLKILAEFNTQQEWILEPGDMLYLPPHLAHFGIAQDECMTYSVGFRSPSQQELIESWMDQLLINNKALARYSDNGRKVQLQHGKIEQQDIQALKTHLIAAITDNDELFNNWLGSYLTESKNPDQEDFFQDDHLASGTSYFRQANNRIAWIEHDDHISLFIDGHSSDWPIQTKDGIEYICDSYQYSRDRLEKKLLEKHFQKLFDHLIEKGVLHKAN